jgi:hypothetical protein
MAGKDLLVPGVFLFLRIDYARVEASLPAFLRLG